MSFGLNLSPVSASASMSFGMQNAQKLGVTSSVVSPGSITLTAPGSDTSVLATLSRDPSGRQVVTVDTHSGFSATLSTEDFNNLTRAATNAQNLLNALSAAIPSDVASQGPAAENTYRNLLALGATQDQANAASQTNSFQTVVNYDRLVASGYQPTLGDFLLMALGLDVRSGDTLSLDGCSTAGSECSANLAQLRAVLRDRTPAEVVALFQGRTMVATSAMEAGVGDPADYADTLLNARLTQLIAGCARSDPKLFGQMVDALWSQPAEVQQAAARAAGMSWDGMVEIAAAAKGTDQQAFSDALEKNFPAALRGTSAFEKGVAGALNLPTTIGVAGVQLATSEEARQQFGDKVAYVWNNPGAVASGLYDGTADFASRLARGEAGAIGSAAAFLALDGLGGFQLTQSAASLGRAGAASVSEGAARLGPAVDAGLADAGSTAGAGGLGNFDWGAAWNVLRSPADEGAGGAVGARAAESASTDVTAAKITNTGTATDQAAADAAKSADAVATDAAVSGKIPEAILVQQTKQDALVANQQQVLKDAIDAASADQKATEFGRIMTQLGQDAQNITTDTLRQIPGAIVEPVKLGSGIGSEVDNLVTVGSRKVYVETKYIVPTDGDSLTRTANQITNAVNQGDGAVILQVTRAPTAGELAILQSRIGPEVFSKVQIVSSQSDLYAIVTSALAKAK